MPRNQDDALGLQRSAYPSRNGRNPLHKEGLALRLAGLAIFQRTLEHVRQKKSTSLKFAQDRFRRSARRGNSDCFQQPSRFAFELSRIKKILVGRGRISA
jgi:hypothetical protein